MFLSNIAGVGECRFSCPPKFGKTHVHVISNLVGLDDHLVLDGNDQVIPSNFTKSPKRKTAPTVFQNSVKGVSDLRINRSSSKKKERAKDNGSKKPPTASSSAYRICSSAVTPSPTPHSIVNTTGGIAATKPIGERSNPPQRRRPGAIRS